LSNFDLLNFSRYSSLIPPIKIGVHFLFFFFINMQKSQVRISPPTVLLTSHIVILRPRDQTPTHHTSRGARVIKTSIMTNILSRTFGTFLSNFSGFFLFGKLILKLLPFLYLGFQFVTFHEKLKKKIDQKCSPFISQDRGQYISPLSYPSL
jgi:hypothetical protein